MNPSTQYFTSAVRLRRAHLRASRERLRETRLVVTLNGSQNGAHVLSGSNLEGALMVQMRWGVLAALAALTGCQSQPAQDELRALSGMELYERLCASCHGVSGRGDGPIAPLIKIGVPDLTRIAARDGGEFPTENVRDTIDGRFEKRGHGPRDMPVWGWQLYDASSEDAVGERAHADSMIDRLVEHLRSIQVEG